MATTEIEVNKSTWTLVLDGLGFVYSEDRIQYDFKATSPTTERGILLPKCSQINGASGQKLWAKAVDQETTKVYSTAV